MKRTAIHTTQRMLVLVVLGIALDGCSSHAMKKVQDGGTDLGNAGGVGGAGGTDTGDSVGAGGVDGGEASTGAAGIHGNGSGGTRGSSPDVGTTAGAETVYGDGFVEPWSLASANGTTVDTVPASGCYRGNACLAATFDGSGGLILQRAQPLPASGPVELQFYIRSLSDTLTGLTVSMSNGATTCRMASISSVTPTWSQVAYIVPSACAGVGSVNQILLTNATGQDIGVVLDEIKFVAN